MFRRTADEEKVESIRCDQPQCNDEKYYPAHNT
jgi:hypothetical protein